jgi:hypothetical protein
LGLDEPHLGRMYHPSKEPVKSQITTIDQHSSDFDGMSSPRVLDWTKPQVESDVLWQTTRKNDVVALAALLGKEVLSDVQNTPLEEFVVA